MNKAQKEHYDRVARLGCGVCRSLGYDTADVGCEIHHIRRAGRRDSSPVIGLCTMHHRGSDGIHGMGRRAWEKKFALTEENLLQQTMDLLNGH